MIAQQKNSRIMLFLLGVLIFIYHLGLGILNARGQEPSPALEFLYEAGFICGVVWWLRAEAKNSPVARIYCAGLLVGSAWPIIIPYHLIKTRGARGLLPLFALIATFIFAWITAVVISLVFSSSNYY